MTAAAVHQSAAPPRGGGPGPATGRLWDMASRFAARLERVGYASYDPYDLWGTRYGVWSRRLYYAGNPLGVVLTAPVILTEILCPRLRAVFVKQERFATADAQLVLGFLNLHELSRRTAGRPATLAEGSREQRDQRESPRGAEAASTSWLSKARDLAEEILGYSIPGYSGYCWGYPFDWQSATGLKRKFTPHITATPYCFEAFIRLFDLTGEARYLDIARSIATFVFRDLRDTPTGEGAAASSYFPDDATKVVNASAYRAWVLFEAAARCGIEEYRDKAWKNLRFILQSQQPDGSWLYAVDDPAQRFIDHFHTCFVLKNLWKLNRHLGSEDVTRAIRHGYQYYRRALYDDQGSPRQYAMRPRLQIVRLEMYDLAEAITLGAHLRDDIPEAFSLAQTLAGRLGDRYQLEDGHFVTRIYLGGIRHTLPYVRWPQAQLFLAITNLLQAASTSDAD